MGPDRTIPQGMHPDDISVNLLKIVAMKYG